MSEDSIGTSRDTLSPATSKPSVRYDKDFVLTDEYRASMPDMQNEGSREIFGANVPILKVGYRYGLFGGRSKRDQYVPDYACFLRLRGAHFYPGSPL